jgi:16S rRNA (cytidine1402-2'-O)-methyltransferase
MINIFEREKGKKRKRLEDMASYTGTIAYYVGPHHLSSVIDMMFSVFGDRRCCVARELTKLHEEIKRGTINQVRDYYTEKEPKGEITLIVAGREKEQNWDQKHLLKTIQQESEKSGGSPSQLAKKLAKESGWSRKDIYDLMQGLQDKKS